MENTLNREKKYIYIDLSPLILDQNQIFFKSLFHTLDRFER
jgi:hypothetical protein